MKQQEEYICFFNSHKAWGGGEKWHSEAACYFHDKNYKVVVCGNKNGELLKKLPENIEQENISFRNSSFFNPLAYLRVHKILKRYNISTIILCLPIDIKIAGIIAKLHGIHNIIYRRGSAIPIKNSISNRFLFSRIITAVIANSEATKNTILQNNANLINSDKITVLYNGISIPAQQEKIPHKTFTIGTACRLEPQKNLFSLIEIADRLKSQNLDFKILIAGEGSLKEELQNTINSRNLEKNISIIGFCNDMPKFYSSLDVFVLTSLWEGFGYVLAEAMTFNLPLIAYNVSSNPELIVNDLNGFLIPLNNTVTFTEKLTLLMQNKDLCGKMGINARKYVDSKFNIITNLQKTEQFICNL